MLITPPVPVDAILPALMHALQASSRAILVAPPGSGKTTRVPLYLAGLIGEISALPGKILVLEPRRLAARSASRYMARMLGQTIGEQVGFRVRLENKVSGDTRVELITEGILTRKLLADPELKGVACVIFDEFHERNLQADLGLALCLEAQQALRPDLKLVVMSATLDVAALSEFLAPCPVLQAEGRIWPVNIRYVPPVRRAGQRPDPACMVAESVALAVRRALAEETGSVLAFLPGTGEIRRAAALLHGHLPAGTQLFPLYGDLPAAEQDAAINPCPIGQRKVVLSTALAETSLTIEGVRVVVDGGFSRTARHDSATDMNRLVTERVTQSGADQRAGRAGRTEPGVCYRLWDKGDMLLPQARPEIMEGDLAPLLLDCLIWGAQPETMSWLTLPPESAMTRARQTLTLLGVLDNGYLTPHGKALARLPLHPRLGHMVLMAGEHTALAACLAAIVSDRDPQPGHADIRTRLACFHSNQRLKRMAEQIYGLSGSSSPFRLPAPQDEDMSGLLLSLAWPDRIAQRREPGSFRLASGKGAFLPIDDPLAHAPLLAIASLHSSTSSNFASSNFADSRIFLAAPLSLTDLDQGHGFRIRTVDTVCWDKREQTMAAVSRVCLDALILEERPLPLSGELADAARQACMEGIRSLGLSVLPWTDDLRQWQSRVVLLRALEPEQGWPDVSDPALLDSLELWLEPHLSGITRRTHFARISLAEALHSLTPWPLDQRLSQEAPTRITVPTGNSIRIDYTCDGGPALAVKLQEMFGQVTTPTIASGRVPLTLHLLSPAGRPLQVTRDLEHFWNVSYFAVRADMRGRYPKHPWPDKPLDAMPTARVKKKSEK